MRPAALVALLAAVALGGCLGAVADPGPATGSPDTATVTSYPNESVRFPPGPKERPPLPETLTSETAADYAIAHEFRYSYNELKDSVDTGVGLSEHSCHVDSTEQRDDGYLVTVQCSGYVNRPAAGATVTEHVDLAPWTVRYYVDGNSVLRTELA